MSSTKDPLITTALEAELDAALHETLDENEALKADIAALQAENQRLQDWIMGDEPDALTALQRVYSDPQTDQAGVIKSASAALPFERPKPASQVNATFKLFDFMEAMRLKEQQAKTIEHQPKLDLEAPTPPTILGGDDSAA
jgi:hypothetical protein